MTDTQVITIVIAILASLGAVVYNNSRITDSGKRIDDLRDMMNQRFNDVNRHIDDKFSLLSQQMARMEEKIMRVLGDHATRIHKLERPNER